jgi:hypothetical protein
VSKRQLRNRLPLQSDCDFYVRSLINRRYSRDGSAGFSSYVRRGKPETLRHQRLPDWIIPRPARSLERIDLSRGERHPGGDSLLRVRWGWCGRDGVDAPASGGGLGPPSRCPRCGVGEAAQGREMSGDRFRQQVVRFAQPFRQCMPARLLRKRLQRVVANRAKGSPIALVTRGLTGGRTVGARVQAIVLWRRSGEQKTVGRENKGMALRIAIARAVHPMPIKIPGAPMGSVVRLGAQWLSGSPKNLIVR